MAKAKEGLEPFPLGSEAAVLQGCEGCVFSACLAMALLPNKVKKPYLVGPGSRFSSSTSCPVPTGSVSDSRDCLWKPLLRDRHSTKTAQQIA